MNQPFPVKQFRFHRGTLDESLDTMVPVWNLDSVREQFVKMYGYAPHGELKCKHYCYDDRIDWDTWIISDDDGPIGFSKGELK